MPKIFELNYQSLYEINTTPESGTATWSRIGAGITSADPSNNESKDQTNYLDGDGYAESEIIGAQFTLAFSGHRVHGDAAQDWIASIEHELGDNRKTQFRYTDMKGNQKTGNCTVVDIDFGGGDAASKKEISFGIDVNGKPTVTPATAATALEATVAPGTVLGTTSFKATAGSGNSLAYKLKSATQGTVYGGSYAENYIAYTSEANIAATAGQFLCMYELSPYKHVVKYYEVKLATTDIKKS